MAAAAATARLDRRRLPSPSTFRLQRPFLATKVELGLSPQRRNFTILQFFALQLPTAVAVAEPERVCTFHFHPIRLNIILLHISTSSGER